MITGNEVAPTSTVLQARVALFQPSQRPVLRHGDWVETSFGKCQVFGRLGQRHADVLESILYVAEKKRETDDGGIELLVDPAKVRKLISKQYSHDGLWVLLKEIMSAVIEIESNETRMIGHIIDHVVESNANRKNPLGGTRSLWRVRLGSALVSLLKNDLHLHYNPQIVASLTHGVSQAVARHVLTHRNVPTGGWHIDTLIKAVSSETASSSFMRNCRFRLKQDAEILKEIGIEITDENRLRRFTAAR